MLIYEYRCPAHGVVLREPAPRAEFDWRCPRQYANGMPCNRRVMILRIHTNVDVRAPDDRQHGLSSSAGSVAP
jgi:hypothetical protein